MKIDQFSTGSLGSGGLDRAGLEKAYGIAKPDRQGGAAAASGQGESDRISLSQLSHRLMVEQTESPERVARVEQLAADVQAGRYKVDAGRLSGLLVDDALGAGQ